ncbi:MAG: JAB domain-containing protein [Rhodothermales bacterium]|nr:JAB domain-containing protein [Rhodothermales bacterium]
MNTAPLPRLNETHQLELAFDGAPVVQVRLVRDVAHSFQPRIQVHSPEDVARVVAPYFDECAAEEFLTVNLNTANVVINIVHLTRGGLAASIVEPRMVFQAAILSNAAAIVCCHNHPSGNPEPSREDIRITRQLVEAGKILGIPIHDHLIITGRAYTSFAERGLMN